MLSDLLPGHPCRAVLTRDEGGWTGPETHRTCGKTDDQKPMAFRGEWWCSDQHRKKVEGVRKANRSSTRASQLADYTDQELLTEMSRRGWFSESPRSNGSSADAPNAG